MAERSGERGDAAWGLRLLGEIEVLGEAFAEGTAVSFRRSLSLLAAELEMSPLVAHCHFRLGRLSRRAGERQEAQEHLTTAVAMYREMDMRFYLDQAHERDTH